MEETNVVEPWQMIFPARITAASGVMGRNVYAFTEQAVDPDTGYLRDALCPRTGDFVNNPLFELNDISVPVPCTGWVRYRGASGSFPVYEFMAPFGDGSSYVADVGDGSSNPVTVTHDLNTTSVIVTVIKNSNKQIVYPTVTVTSSNAISIQFATTPTSNQYKVLVSGSGGTSSADVIGPASSTADAVVTFADTSGKLLQNGVVLIDPVTGAITTGSTVTGPSGGLTVNGSTSNGSSLSLIGTTGNTGTLTLTGSTGNGGGVVITSSSGTTPGDITFVYNTTATNTTNPVITLKNTSTGTVTTGFGTGITAKLPNGVGTLKTAATLNLTLTDATAGSEDADFIISLIQAGVLTEAARITSLGALRLPYTTGVGTPPTGYGTTYWGTDGKLYAINGTGTTTVLTSPGGGYATTVTFGGTTTLTSSSPQQQFFTGLTTQTVGMPDVTTLTLGQKWLIDDLSLGAVTVNSYGGNLIATVPSGGSVVVTCIDLVGTTASSWAATPLPPPLPNNAAKFFSGDGTWQFVRTTGTLAAAGSSQGDAAPIVTDSVQVTGADGTKGVILPNNSGAIVVVWNSDASHNLNVYPPIGASINMSGTDTPLSVVNKDCYQFSQVSATLWFAVLIGASI